jgi:hypothetical protein
MTGEVTLQEAVETAAEAVALATKFADLWDEARAERDAARRVLLSIAARLAAASEVIGRRAYRKDEKPCPHCLTLR